VSRDKKDRDKPAPPPSTSGASASEFDQTIATPASASGSRPAPVAASKPPSALESSDTIVTSDPKLPSDPARPRSDDSVGSVGIAGPIPSAPTSELPATIGRYRILGKLGEGGMGIVYDAEQQDPRRRVALKVVRGGRFVDENSIRMFRREAETLARLRHPNIGAIYESGRTDDGQHFFAMELVLGKELDDFLKQRGKPMARDEVRFRLALFRRVADAVHYAHQRGVIHRDLKPSNIIVSDEDSSIASAASLSTLAGIRLPDIKILDFGLARITEGDVHATQVTEVGAIKGTLPYMAPEQARGSVDAIDVRTDVYALGVILYEMLSGQKPYDVGRASLLDAVRVICEEPPRSLRHSLSGQHRLDPDIETIVGKALEKDPNRRYASAAAMGEDIDRYLSSQPITARPPSTMYQLQKFAGRNRALVAGLAATFVVLVAGTVVSSMQAMRATRAEALANQRMEQALAAESRARAEMREATMARMLAEYRKLEADSQKVIAEFERFIAANERKAAVESGARATVEAAKATAINRFLQEMLATADPWAGDAGKVTLDAALERARQRIGVWAGTDPDVDVAIRGTIATGFAGMGRLAEAESLLAGGLARLATEAEPRPHLAATLHRQIGALLVQGSQYGRAEREFRAALEQQRLASRRASDTTAYLMSQVAAALAYQGRFSDADTAARAAAEAVRTSGAATGQAAPAVLRTRAYIAAQSREDFVEADSLLRASVAALATRRESAAQLEASEVLEELAGNRARMGDHAAADSLYREAVGARRRAVGDNHPLVVRALEKQGEFLARTGRVGQTIEVQEQVLAIRQRGLGPESAPVGRTWAGLATGYARAGRLEDAERAYETGIGILRKRLGGNHPDLATALRDYADLRVTQKKLPQAEKLAREALAIRAGRLGPASPGTVAAQVTLADILRARKERWRYASAESLLVSARSNAIAARGARDAGAQRATLGLVQLYEQWGRPADAAKWRAAAGGAAPTTTPR
jgi:serine/threonine protein kinase/tetratricopeptide (TPR) repeat protein